MNIIGGVPFMLMLYSSLQAATAPAVEPDSASVWHRPELDYFKAVNSVGPPHDPQLLFLLMGQYLSANQQREGIEFIGNLEKEFEPRLTDRQKSLYFGAIGLLRASYANEVSFLQRIGWVKETIRILEKADHLSGGEVFVVRWIEGVVYAQLPALLGKRGTARADLVWCLEHADQAPHGGWLREVYYRLATLHRQDGDELKAAEYLRLSGYAEYGKTITLTTPFGEDLLTGHTFSPKRIREVVPGRIYALSGYEFTEYYFVVSADGRQLIGIDAGTRPDSARAAYEALRLHAPNLPTLTTILVTHAHWDHIGGHAYFRGLEPSPRFYARGNYQQEIDRELRAPDLFAKNFFGSRFSMDEIRSFRPDETVDRRTAIRIGGTDIEIIPIEGGETHDGLFYYLPEDGVLFAGDFVMPYLGAPFLEEGSIQGLLDAIDVVVQTKPRHLLHGHEPLTRLFASPAMLEQLKGYLAWLQQEVLAAIQRGADRASIQQANLIPPGLLAGDPDAHLPYLVMRENVINRIYDQHMGYWQPDLQGMDYLSLGDRGGILVDYLGVSEQQAIKAAERMITDGKPELAATLLDWIRGRYGNSAGVADVEQRTYQKLMEKYQEFNPFKYIIYSGRIGFQTPQMEERPASRK